METSDTELDRIADDGGPAPHSSDTPSAAEMIGIWWVFVGPRRG